MNATDALIAWLANGPRHGTACVVGWRVEIAETESLRAGIRDGRLGGPYEAPGAATRLAGSLVLSWSDGRLTRTRLDRAAIESPDGEIATWRALASRERRPTTFAASARVPTVLTHDAALASAVASAPASLLQLLGAARAAAAAGDVQRLDATLRVGAGRRTVVTSAGFWCRWAETACSLEIWIDELAEAAFSKRRRPGDAELSALLGEAIERGRLLRRDDGLPPRARGVLFMPAAVEALLGRFLLGALAGRAVVDGRSPFTRPDLDEGRQVLRSDLSLLVDTTLPFELATAPCSPDGVPGGRAVLIEAGRLVGPVLDLSTAAELGRPPTPSPRGRPLLLLDSACEALELDEGLAALGAGLVVRDLPGLHTQGAHRWTYALVVPDAQAVREGRLAGRASARLRGNLLEHLTSASTRLVRVPGELNPGLLVLDGVTLEAA